MTDVGAMALALCIQFVVLAALAVWVWSLEKAMEDTQADADEALSRVDAIEAHLTGLEPEGAGRHACPKPPSYAAGPVTRGGIVELPGSRVGGSGEAARPPTDEGAA